MIQISVKQCDKLKKDSDNYDRLKHFIKSNKLMLMQHTNNTVVAMIRLDKLEMLNTIEDFIEIIE